jgi:hypothetical protein
VRRRARRALLALGAALLAAQAMAARAVRAEILVYPADAPPCDETLQDCIDGARPGDTVQIAESPIDESLEIDKSIVLTSAPRLSGPAVIGGGLRTRSVVVLDDGATDGLTVTLSRLSLQNAQLAILLSAGSGHTVQVRDCLIRHSVPDNGTTGVDIELRTPATVILGHNRIETTGQPIGVFTRTDGDIALTFVANVLTTTNPAVSGTGIALDHRAPTAAGRVTTDILSNVLYNVAGCNCLGATGISVSALESVQATVDIVNNTLHRAKAIEVKSPPMTSRLDVNVFNNIVNEGGEPVDFPAVKVPHLTIRHGFNDLVKVQGFVNGHRAYLPEAPNPNVVPRFVNVDNADFRLRSNSLIIDAGINDPPGGLPSEDADGNMRIAGFTVDIGAYEFGSSVPPSTTSTSTTTVTSVTTTTSTSTTTIPESCVSVPTFDSIDCRLLLVVATVRRDVERGSIQDQMLAAVGEAQSRTVEARDLYAAGDVRGGKAAMRRAVRAVGAFNARLRSRRVRRLVDRTLRRTLGELGGDLREDLKALRRA